MIPYQAATTKIRRKYNSDKVDLVYVCIGNEMVKLKSKGSRKNKFIILGGEASVWQGAKTQEYQDIPSFRNAARRDASAYKM